MLPLKKNYAEYEKELIKRRKNLHANGFTLFRFPNLKLKSSELNLV